jgi:hypothetical protein
MTAGLYALMKAQVRRLVVEENTDLSPLRQRNVQRRHYERNLASVKPPLPPDIMEELRRKTLGIHKPSDDLDAARFRLGPPERSDPEDETIVETTTLGSSNTYAAKRASAQERRRRRRWYSRLLAQIPIFSNAPSSSSNAKPTTKANASGNTKPGQPICDVPIPAVFFDPLASGKTIPVVNELDKRGMSEEALANMQHTKKGRKR